MQEQPSRKQLLSEMENLRRELENLKRDKADLEILLEMSVAHADEILETLQATSLKLDESNQQLKAEIQERQRTETALQISQAALKVVLANTIKEKSDLEILWNITTEHGDVAEDVLYDQNIHDPLTGLFNRRYLENFLEREIYRDRRSSPLSIIMCDIDNFKQFNTTFGHQAGDTVLQKVGLLFQKNTRDSDICCRYGGEEFMLIVPDASLEDALEQAEQLRQEVKNLNVEHLHQLLGNITISLGVACFPEHGKTSEQLIQSADIALNYAKTSGRDRVAVAGCLIPTRESSPKDASRS